MTINDQQIDSIIDRVVSQLTLVDQPDVDQPDIARPVPPRPLAQNNHDESDLSMRGCFFDIESAIAAAKQAFAEYQLVRVADRKKIIDTIRVVCLENLSKIAKLAWEETGLGRVEDKIKKMN